MKLSIIGSTKPGYQLSAEEALLFSGREAGICYMPDSFDALSSEPEDATIRRALGTLKSGHHSVMGHVSYNLILEDAPKIIAMLLNNEHEYNTSEKSARYTTMKTTALEQQIYEKWIAKFERLIAAEYPQIGEKAVHKLALENARYFISVFTPATTMGYTVTLRQANYIINWSMNLALRAPENVFLEQLSPFLVELAAQLKQLVGVDGLCDNKGRGFTLFSNAVRATEWGESYSVNYKGTFSQLAQAQRHRSLFYEMRIPDLNDVRFYVPPIIHDFELNNEYLSDMEKLANRFPQGMLVEINERGTAEKFVEKCQERLCGAAQREICIRTRNTLEQYYANTSIAHRGAYQGVHNLLEPYLGKTKCQFGHYSCSRPCPLGPAMAFERLV